MSVATGSPPLLSKGVLIRSYVAHTDGLKDAAPMRAGERRHHSRVVGVATGLKLIGSQPGNYRDWALEGWFEMIDAATLEGSQATRMFNRDRKFFISVRDLLRTGKAVEFSYDFYVERLTVGGGLKKRLEITSLASGSGDLSPRVVPRPPHLSVVFHLIARKWRRREHRVAILAPLALLDPQQHALGVDIRHLQRHHLGDPQTRRVGGAQPNSVF